MNINFSSTARMPFICVCLYIYVRMCTCIHVFVYICVCLSVCNVSVYVQVCLSECKCVCLCASVSVSHKKMVRPVQQTWTLHQQCAKHTQHAKHANARGSGGMPPKKILKNRCCQIESGRYFNHKCLLQM